MNAAIGSDDLLESTGLAVSSDDGLQHAAVAPSSTETVADRSRSPLDEPNLVDAHATDATRTAALPRPLAALLKAAERLPFVARSRPAALSVEAVADPTLLPDLVVAEPASIEAPIPFPAVASTVAPNPSVAAPSARSASGPLALRPAGRPANATVEEDALAPPEGDLHTIFSPSSPVPAGRLPQGNKGPTE